ncbi:CRISPR system CASCADE complex protein CasA [Lactobacillus equicursoris DSM 19284 = JCM 14600 = CIP 110162]|uniref:Crispr-associated protein n=1 Tax=Lactobacillus equicursoris DSM 19284 = JCM 14600 = CIP 110162 TaxID=1293597 RepID=K0NUD2_9LACO|nr:type I-E CRISPR-associated protein Cse1/CasA [Lactobacillus equicursoris]KRL00237.1 crispr-associated protein [Lactobacillus equicursoris DSM 19284 = JCM 14600 = CIP 110162]CCK86079.1 CRISPR system CASCADE complex protein CasA [Lactobacillus equicursoris DSM 19284 = JCM 14600 = CIP 110162]
MDSFNLVTEPWIKVLESKTNSERLVSIEELLKNAKDYRQIAGEMHGQDLAVLRLLEAILTTIYSRVNEDGQAYEWLKLDERMQVVGSNIDEAEFDSEELLNTWEALSSKGGFTDAVFNYLDRNADLFDFFGSHPFYQVTKEQYDAHVVAAKRVDKGKGTVDLMQMNRLISQSGNSVALFAPKSAPQKNKMSIDELVRWVISYQNFTGVTDKTKVVAKEKMSNGRGWLYTLNPIYIKGKNLFETLLLNMILLNDDEDKYTIQKPVWEEDLDSYVKKRLKQIKPDNYAEVYTVWSRLLHIEWKDDVPTVFSAGLPAFNSTNAFDIEPMSTWRKDKDGNWIPATRQLSSLGWAMWRNFGQYVPLEKNEGKQPLIIEWINILKEGGYIQSTARINLHTTGIISNGGATSLMPAAEFDDNLQIEADVLFDENPDLAKKWPARIEEMVELNQTVGRKYYGFLMEIGTIRFGSRGAGDFAGRKSQDFYDNLNEPFTNWLSGLSNQDEREEKVREWKDELQKLSLQTLDQFLEQMTPRDITGVKKSGNDDADKDRDNIFKAASKFKAGVWKVIHK